MLDLLISYIYITKIWGSRCSDFEPTCIVCEKWREHDEIFIGEDND